MSTTTMPNPLSTATPAKSTATRPLQVQTYLSFNGRCEEAIQFYQRALGAEVMMLMRFKDAPPSDGSPGACSPAAGMENKVMHATFRVGSTEIFASDGGCTESSGFQGFTLSLTAPTEAEADRLFTALGDGGQVHMPLAKTFFAARFGVVADRFGVSWMVIAGPQGGPS